MSYFKIILFSLFINSVFVLSQTQEQVSTQYMIGGIELSGNSSLEKNSILSLINLEVGKNIFIPGEEIKNATKTLWSQDLFSDVQIFQTKIEGNIIFLEIYLDQLPRLDKFQFKGLKKSEIDNLRDQLDFIKGMAVGEQTLSKAKNQIEKYLSNSANRYDLEFRQKN